MDFDEYSAGYSDEVQRAIVFAGPTVDYCTEIKATILKEICEKYCGALRQLQVLDLGCGVGMTDAYLKDAFAQLSGVDLSEQSIAQAVQRNPGVHYQSYGGDTLPFPDGRFDVVFTICVMHHVPPAQWNHFVAEMRRVTRSGGINVVFEHNPFNPLTRLTVNRCPFDADAVLLSRRLTTKLLARAKLDVVESRFFLFFPFRFPSGRVIERFLGPLPLGGQYYAVGRRAPEPLDRVRAA
jgi:SAM-dependent methyltransferase